jgi:hypothetical protein
VSRFEKTVQILTLPPVDWDKTIAELNTDERYELERQITCDAVQLARFSAYLSRRMAGGKHVDAVKRQNSVARRVRLALGYTYADDRITF